VIGVVEALGTEVTKWEIGQRVGIGGLGHFAVQYAYKAGFNTVAISRGSAKESLVRGLGAHHYIDSDTQNPAQALQALGGSKVILATAPNAKAISSLLGGLASDSELVIVAGSGQPLEWSAMDFLKGPHTVRGSFTGHAPEVEQAIRFSVLTDVRPMIETFPLERAGEAFERVMNAEARFLPVLHIYG
jgi:propanol-preferring alcohol dehydrogenase